jgi:hypothetical protein
MGFVGKDKDCENQTTRKNKTTRDMQKSKQFSKIIILSSVIWLTGCSNFQYAKMGQDGTLTTITKSDLLRNTEREKLEAGDLTLVTKGQDETESLNALFRYLIAVEAIQSMLGGIKSNDSVDKTKIREVGKTSRARTISSERVRTTEALERTKRAVIQQ